MGKEKRSFEDKQGRTAQQFAKEVPGYVCVEREKPDGSTVSWVEFVGIERQYRFVPEPTPFSLKYERIRKANARKRRSR